MTFTSFTGIWIDFSDQDRFSSKQNCKKYIRTIYKLCIVSAYETTHVIMNVNMYVFKYAVPFQQRMVFALHFLVVQSTLRKVLPLQPGKTRQKGQPDDEKINFSNMLKTTID